MKTRNEQIELEINLSRQFEKDENRLPSVEELAEMIDEFDAEVQTKLQAEQEEKLRCEAEAFRNRHLSRQLKHAPDTFTDYTNATF